MLPALKIIPAIAPVVGGAAVLAWRFRETRTPVTTAKIVIPPLGMSTGLSMFVVPAMRIPWTWAAVALLTGVLVLSYPLARTSRLERRGGVVYMQRSNGFLVILLALLALRLALHEYVGSIISPGQTAAVFFLLAFGMIVRWRAGMYRRYRKLVEPSPETPGEAWTTSADSGAPSPGAATPE